MIEITNKTNQNFNFTDINKIAKDLTKKDIELIITDNQEIQELNKQHRGKDAPTDVLSFPINSKKILGSIVVSVDFVKDASNRYKHSLDDELTLLFIHGVLHLLGYDHETDNGEMRQKEEHIIKRYNLPKSLIIRNEG